MEYIGNTKNNNILMSDYAHHPTEIELTLTALKEKYPDKKLITIFQPHQHNRTIELIEDFK
jgi:UDP-N-acetylmuramate--alanine ligase